MSTPRPRSFFSGGELRGLLVFAVIMAVGWPVILNYARPKQRAPEPPPPVDSRPLEPDKGIEFDRLLDKTPLGTRDNAAYKILLQRARETPAAELAKKARRDVMYTQFWDTPRLYRGVPIHLEGTLQKVIKHEKLNPELVPGGTLYECWFFTREANHLPYVVEVQEPPPGLKAGIELNERVVVDAYFFRLFGYVAGDATRAAPAFVGRLRWESADAKTGALVDPGANGNPMSSNLVYLVAGVLGLYVIARLFLAVQRSRLPAVKRTGLMADDRPVEEIAPGAIADLFAAAAAAEDDEDEIKRDPNEPR